MHAGAHSHTVVLPQIPPQPLTQWLSSKSSTHLTKPKVSATCPPTWPLLTFHMQPAPRGSLAGPTLALPPHPPDLFPPPPLLCLYPPPMGLEFVFLADLRHQGISHRPDEDAPQSVPPAPAPAATSAVTCQALLPKVPTPQIQPATVQTHPNKSPVLFLCYGVVCNRLLGSEFLSFMASFLNDNKIHNHDGMVTFTNYHLEPVTCSKNFICIDLCVYVVISMLLSPTLLL